MNVWMLTSIQPNEAAMRTLTWKLILLLSLISTAAQTPDPTNKYWAVEDAAAREKLPLYKIIPAAKTSELTRSDGYP